MPTYEYRCPKGHAFELFQRMSDEPVADCPECGAKSERQFSAGGGFLFKGDGFYITDYRSSDYKKQAKAESGGAGDSGSGASGAGSSGSSGSGSSGSTGGASTPAPSAD